MNDEWMNEDQENEQMVKEWSMESQNGHQNSSQNEMVEENTTIWENVMRMSPRSNVLYQRERHCPRYQAENVVTESELAPSGTSMKGMVECDGRELNVL